MIIFYLIISIILGIISYTFYKNHNKKVQLTSNASKYDHAIILGGSFGGMATAAYLSKYFKRITIIESDDVLNDTFNKSTPSQILDYRCRLESPTSIGRSGVSQIYQLHALEGEGFKIMHELFPHLKDKLINEYGIRTYSLKNESRFIIDGNLLNQNLTKDIDWLGIDRFTLEIALRKELCLQFENQIEWKCNARVIQLIADQSSNTVQGVKYRLKQNTGSPLLDIYGDFIIDCTGRNTSSIKWLKESLNLIVPSVQMYFGCGYVTFIGERFKTGNPLLDSKHILCANTNTPDNNVGCYITPIRTIKTDDENSLGTLSTIAVHCVNEEYPPNDSYENLLEWIKEHLSNEFNSILNSTKVCSPLVPYRRAIDDRKYVELLGKKWPHNYILLADAMCTFNPQFGQGMTHAFRHALELSKIFDERCHKLENISYIFNRRASKISEECWLGSTTSDWKSPTLKLIKTNQNGKIETYERGGDSDTTKCTKPQLPFMIKFMQWYNYWFFRCASKSEQLSTDFIHVVNQHNSPFILMKPITFLQVCYMALTHRFGLSKN
ncbi:unnamed protein product [Rotaria sp. Silwood2]|nr:unnamed protein product [Rotaria sp. Silwood2]CAF3401505.1 unnamed protein product [Rotaria sp. Silwood2]CAF4161606.1 unnamed protein product [Rotaria sp. Silwood2]CAF4427483.1 unnamed protein product [Rotaria sp. Silwood2]